MSRAKTLYIEGDSIFHKLNGISKILLFLTWTIMTVMFLDIRFFLVMGIVGTIMLYFSQIPSKTIKPLLWIMVVFNIINIIFILLITPQYGTELVGTNTEIINIGYSYINKETLFYVLTISLKYAVLMPITVIFIFTTHPSEFASSLNKMGIPYKIAYAINIAFRYIPDVMTEYKNILDAQQARGLAFNKGEGTIIERLKNYTTILVPLVSSSMKRIETVSNAMELRSFGKKRKRTWYSYKKLKGIDYAFIIGCVALLVTAVYLKNNMMTGFYYPF
ncbi:energy-coupling factor transporter transmembrane component T family protein [Terrisporobacter sp.]|uniref:energy-coupling factor transporter transmembrane component T family protein n=1 Tax=Terrisporobacter sp. TaxID=1965305 RepID=UPI002612CAAB|nr:energy-coupling factor transporter transmembrane component T [Terrisporobacter sp.]